MKIISYIPLTRMQDAILDEFQKIEVRPALTKPSVVATIKTSLRQEIKVTINSEGIIEHVKLVEC